MVKQFETRQWIPYPVELVFAFFANPTNLPHLMPPGLQARIEDARLQAPPPRPVASDPARQYRSVAAGAGSEILISFYPVVWVPKRMSWLTRITEFAWNSHFCDEQVRGPFDHFRHRHGIEAETRDGREGTLVTDTIEYALPFMDLGFVGGLVARRKLVRMFAYRQERLPAILELAGRQAGKKAGD